MSAEKALELIGDDSQIFSGKLSSTELVGDGTKTLAELQAVESDGGGMFIVTAKATESFFPSLLKVGELYPADGTEVLKTGDKVKKLALTHIADATSWSFAISREKIDTTRLIHRYKKYRLGKFDASGTLNSIFTVGITDANNGLISKTMKSFHKASGGTITIKEVDDSPLYFLGFVRKTEVAGETEDFIFGQIYLHDMTLGGQSGSAQSYDSNMSLTGLDPVFYSIDIPLAPSGGKHMAVLVISKEKTYVPRFNGNRDEPKETQCVVRYKNPTIDLKNQIITTPVAIGEYDEEGKSKGLKVEIKQNDDAMIRRMTVSISNLGYQEEENGDITWIKNGGDLLKAPVAYDSLIKELVELYNRELNATGVNEKN